MNCIDGDKNYCRFFIFRGLEWFCKEYGKPIPQGKVFKCKKHQDHDKKVRMEA